MDPKPEDLDPLDPIEELKDDEWADIDDEDDDIWDDDFPGLEF